MAQERLVFGVTIDQVDELNTLLRTITANGDMVHGRLCRTLASACRLGAG
jgi:hypothetical protein